MKELLFIAVAMGTGILLIAAFVKVALLFDDAREKKKRAFELAGMQAEEVDGAGYARTGVPPTSWDEVQPLTFLLPTKEFNDQFLFKSSVWSDDDIDRAMRL